MRHIKLDRQDERIKQFVLSLALDSGGSILELKGQPVLCIMPAVIHDTTIDKAKLKSAILNRRNESRRLNADWEAADREVWGSLPETGESHSMPRIPRPHRGDVWLVSLDPTVGHEIRKTRPAVVVTSEIYNAHNWLVTVMPLTSHDEAAYDQVLIQPPEGGVISLASRCPTKCDPWTVVVSSGVSVASARKHF